jgi:hypothetical protein
MNIKGSVHAILVMKSQGCSRRSLTAGLSYAAPIWAGNLISGKGNGETDDEAGAKLICWIRLVGAP